jgi:predicted SAM-dependent methyltransferase
MLKAIQFLLQGHPRRAYRQFVMGRTLRSGQQLKLHLGCGQRALEGFVNIDHNYSPATNYVCNIESLPCKDGTVARIESYHVIEHIPHPRIAAVLRAWHRALMPGGVIVAECPDFDRAICEYNEGHRDRIYSIYGKQRFLGDTHYFGYNEERLVKLFASCGFEACEVSEGTDYHAAQEPCLRIECRKPFNGADLRDSITSDGEVQHAV